MVHGELYAHFVHCGQCQGIVGDDEVTAQFTHGYVVECLPVFDIALPDGAADVLLRQHIFGCGLDEHAQQRLSRGGECHGVAVPVVQRGGVEVDACVAYEVHALQVGHGFPHI